MPFSMPPLLGDPGPDHIKEFAPVKVVQLVPGVGLRACAASDVKINKTMAENNILNNESLPSPPCIAQNFVRLNLQVQIIQNIVLR
jgi:hypothetical protein